MTHLIVKKCSINRFSDDNFPMVIAVIKDLDHHQTFEIAEWLKDDTHVVRRNSCIEENEQVDLDLIPLNEILDLLDNALMQMKQENIKVLKKAFHKNQKFLKMLQFFGRIKIWM